MKKRVFRILGLAALLVVMMVTTIPSAVYAQDWPDVDDYYYTSTGAVRVYDMDGNRVAVYRGLGLAFTSQDDSVVGGELDIYTVSSTRGTYIQGGDGTINRIRLREGDNTITVTAFGTHTIVLPAGVEAIATSGTATVTGSPLSLEAGGTRDIPTTGNGDFTLEISRVYETIGLFSGVVGEGGKARFQLIGTQVYATATEDSATLTGSPVKCVPASTTIDVSGAGTVDIDVPYGMVGTATSGTATVVGSPVDLPGGETTEIDTGVTTGTVTIGLQVQVGYNISGAIRENRAGEVAYLKGRIDGFIVTDTEEWTIYQVNVTFTARPHDRI